MEKTKMIQGLNPYEERPDEERSKETVQYTWKVILDNKKEMPTTHVAIIEKIHNGDESALEDMDAEFGFRARWLMGDILKNEEDVKECWNDVLHSVWRTIGAAKDKNFPKNLKAYVIKAARNKAIDRRRQAKPGTQPNPEDPSDTLNKLPAHDNVEEEVQSREMERAIASYVKELSRDEKRLFGYLYIRCLKTKDIAELLNEDYGTVGSRISRLRKKIHNHLVKEGFIHENDRDER